jgi:hypothetical protein
MILGPSHGFNDHPLPLPLPLPLELCTRRPAETPCARHSRPGVGCAARKQDLWARGALACTGSFVTRPPEAGGVGVTGPGRRGEARQVAQSRWALNEAARPFTSLLCSVILNSGRYRRVCSAISYCPRMSSACPSSPVACALPLADWLLCSITHWHCAPTL